MAQSKELIVELYGMGTINKGAYLLMKATIQELSKMDHKIIFCSIVRSGETSLSLAKEGVMQIPKTSRRTYLWNKILLNFFPRRLRRSFGIIMDREIDVIVDGSGFGYGDVWEKSIDKRYLKRMERVKRNGGKVILLPQALGPFTKEQTAYTFTRILKNANRVYARDTISLQNAMNFNSLSGNIGIAPDFTNLISAKKDVGDSFLGRVCVVPNYKMVVHETSANQYVDTLKLIVNYLKNEKNEDPYFLIHEGEKDYEIAKVINSNLDIPLKIIWPDDPLEIKRMISCSKFAIVSRYHALVSALSQAVPVLSTSWSHKYEMLMKDYNNDKYLIKLEPESIENAYELIDELCNNNTRIKIKHNLEKAARIEKTKALENWEEIRLILN